ncbi:phage portal protein [uncultured Paludibaculum sp.]|uniref:phage portal protein n=1 Tax=uncultured Paludibaculum sp. TaxID=1765020 RepID=UPI002AAAD85F|nr:phage portal protein [uncultured Paludibaculum sp.]
MSISNFINRLLGRAPEVRSAALWDAAGGGNRLANWRAFPKAPNAWLDNPITVRARSEGEFRNNPWARRVVDSTLAAVVGSTGLNPQFKDRNAAALWTDWADHCDAAARLDWVQTQSLILQTVMVSGECFVQFVINPDAAVPLSLQVLGPEFLDTSRVDGNTFAGIRYDGTERVGYWLFERHPALAPATIQSVFVPATECVHVFRPIASGAERGIPWLAPVLLALRELQEYSEAALVRAKVASLYSGFVQTADGSNPLNGTNSVPTLEPGSMVRLQPGEIVEFSEPPDVGPTFDPFIRAQLRKIAAGSNVPYEILSGDLSAVTFASGRHGLLEWRRHIEAVQYALLVPQLCAPVLSRWMRMAVSLGALPTRAKARWIGPQIALLDEKAETAATIMKIRAGLTSRAESVSANGWSIDEIDAEIAADNARADRLGLVLDSDPRKTTTQGQEQASANEPQTTN